MPTGAQYRQATYIWYDLVQLSSEPSNSRLGKMRAEYRMLEGLYTAFALTLPIYLGWWVSTRGAVKTELLLIATAGFVLSCWSAVRLFQTFQRSVINEYYLTRAILPVAEASWAMANKDRGPRRNPPGAHMTSGKQPEVPRGASGAPGRRTPRQSRRGLRARTSA